MRKLAVLLSIMPAAQIADASAVRAADARAPAALAALARLQPGPWALRNRDPREPAAYFCVQSKQDLMQPRHSGRACSQFVVENLPNRASVTYQCAGSGHGQTALRVETARLVQIDAQGVADGYPFAFSLEGRQVAACTAKPPAK